MKRAEADNIEEKGGLVMKREMRVIVVELGDEFGYILVEEANYKYNMPSTRNILAVTNGSLNVKG